MAANQLKCINQGSRDQQDGGNHAGINPFCSKIDNAKLKRSCASLQTGIKKLSLKLATKAD